MPNDGVVAPPVSGDRGEWARLYRGYADFYNVPMNEEILATVWGWIHDPTHEVEGFVARAGSGVRGGGGLSGLAHFRSFVRPLRGQAGLFLDDVFVDPAARGTGLGRQLIAAVAAEARARGLNVVRWITADDNYTARTLYDRVATRTMWVTYDLDPDAE